MQLPARPPFQSKRRHHAWSVYGAVLVIVASGLIASSGAPASADRQPRIVFQREVFGSDWRILLSNGKGTLARRLTPLRSANALPRWAPNGRRILYTRASMEGLVDTDLMVMGARGRHKRVLLPGAGKNFIQDLAWAPAARRVVLVMFRDDGPSDLWIYTLATRKLDRLHVARHPDRVIHSVDWSRDGSIVFSAIDFSDDAQEDMDLYLVRSDGTGLRQLTDTPARSEESPIFSPDGRRLVYAARSGRCRYLIVAGPEGTNPRRARAGCDAWRASWTPDSRRLLVQVLNGRRLREEIWAMTVDGTSKRFVVAGTYASWRPR